MGFELENKFNETLQEESSKVQYIQWGFFEPFTLVDVSANKNVLQMHSY